jgi:dihydrofolate reductase
MGRIVMFNHVTVDGYFAAPDGNLDWVVRDDEVDKAAMEGGPQADTLLLGRKTYEMFAAFWPKAVASREAQGPHGGGELSDEQREMGNWLNEARKIVFSRTLKDATWKNTHIVREIDPREIEAMKKKASKDMLVLGSGSIVAELTKHGLIDEYIFGVSPVFLGAGKQLLGGLSKRVNLGLESAKGFPSGTVLLRYARSSRG